MHSIGQMVSESEASSVKKTVTLKWEMYKIYQSKNCKNVKVCFPMWGNEMELVYWWGNRNLGRAGGCVTIMNTKSTVTSCRSTAAWRCRVMDCLHIFCWSVLWYYALDNCFINISTVIKIWTYYEWLSKYWRIQKKDVIHLHFQMQLHFI